jgi:Lon protease-like protein
MAVLPMFPLGSVLFPSLVLPLNVFEPRYRALVHDCLAGDPEFGVVLIERGSEVGGGDVRTQVGTVARMLQCEELPDGRFTLLTVGTHRFRVNAWLPDDPYPLADVDLWPDPDDGDPTLAPAAEAAVSMLRRVLALATEAGVAAVPSTVELADDPALISHQAAALSPLGPFDQQRLLAEPTAGARLETLRAMLVDAEAVLSMRLAGGDDPS